MERNASFFTIARSFKAIFLDSYGVVKNHRGLIPGVQGTINYLRDSGKTLRILTNDASRSPEQQAARFEHQGLKGLQPEEIITSGMMAHMYLVHKAKSGRVAYLGTPDAAAYILRADCPSVPVSDIDLDDIDDISAMVFLDDEGFDWNQDINKTVNLLRKRNIPAIVANSDKLYPVAQNDVSIATGGIARLVESILNRNFIHFGKPDSQMFSYAFDHINQYGQFGKSDILMVGDTLHTDILGGNKFGVATALVFTGNTSPDTVDLDISASGIIPDYICPSIVH
ncbi:HAD-IIA family hydrolase [Phaeodactylibacter luteus]|uniref:HAD-IIA family hydrolase n=1 Tax=Phaeodactylibacter luteus TaxID=1564516 RepID=A0A5C6RWX0_9BACT|nr:HAD-IIA family hydrolase [Phaeodactylibacter luteus]TXB66584.1 HAD-IIA family hydrolase [Phaeodactylibacter luteus]